MEKIYFGGTILTMDEKTVCEAVLVRDSEIVATGSLEDLESRAPRAEHCDLCGSTMLPGFIDAHSHFTQVAVGLLQVSLEGSHNYAEAGDRIRNFIAVNNVKPGEWVQARDYDHNDMPDQRNPGIRILDQMAPQNPLMIQHRSGHFGLANSIALSKLGISAESPAPEGGVIGRDECGLTGYLEENAYFESARKIPLPGAEALTCAYGKAQELYASYGITTMQEGMMVGQMIPMYGLLAGSGLLRLDLVAYPDIDSFEKIKDRFPASYKKYHDHIKIGGIKIFLDGSPQGRTAWMETPYAGEKKYRGYGTMKDDDVTDAFRLAAREKCQILVHCNGDAAAEQMIRCLHTAEEEYPVLRDLRPVLIHGQLLRRDQMPALRNLGAMVSFFVAHVYYWGDVHIRNFGLERASSVSAAHSACETGLSFTFHQDSPVIRPDMLETVWCAVNRRTKAGTGLGADEKIDVLTSLQGVTINAARQYAEEDIKGSITAGKKADFVVLDRNPLATGIENIRGIRILETIKNGETVFKGK